MTPLDIPLPERLESFIREIDHAHSLSEIFAILTTHLNKLGFDKFSYLLL